MELSALWVWLVAGLVLAGAEILVGTFWLLVAGIACLLAAACAWAGISTAWQFSVFAVALIAGGILVRCLSRVTNHDDEASALQNADVGQIVMVFEWLEDGTARVDYRGTQWTAVAAAGQTPQAGRWRIVEVAGSRLVVERL